MIMLIPHRQDAQVGTLSCPTLEPFMSRDTIMGFAKQTDGHIDFATNSNCVYPCFVLIGLNVEMMLC
jgi:hypothetical protein